MSREKKSGVIFTRVCNKVCKNSNENVSVEKHCCLWYSSIAVYCSCDTTCRPWCLVRRHCGEDGIQHVLCIRCKVWLPSLWSKISTDVGLQYIWCGCYLDLQAYAEFSWSFAEMFHDILPLKKRAWSRTLLWVEGAAVKSNSNQWQMQQSKSRK